MTKKNNINKSVRRVMQNYAPPDDYTLSEWADRKRWLSRTSSAEPGPWRNSRTPYMVEPMNAFTDPMVSHITMVASSQVGKSELELNIIGYIVDEDPSSILYIQPTLDDAKKFSTLRIAPMINATKCLKEKMSDVENKNSRQTMLQKQFPGGMLTMVGSNSASGLASTPVRYVLGDELDRWALSAGEEGDPWTLAEARTTTFHNRKLVAVSTGTIKGQSKIERLYLKGTQERWCHQCPDCGKWSEIVFDNVKFTFDTRKVGAKKEYTVKSIGWCCPECGALQDEEAMRKQPAKWIARNPDAYEKGNRSFWLNGFASPWQPWERIVERFLEAKDDPSELQVVYNTMFGQLWEDRGDLEDESAMLSRREPYGVRPDGSSIEVPNGVLVLTCGVDTQDDRLEYEVKGFGHYGENWGIKKGIIMGDPDYDEVWQRLDDVLDHTYQFADKDHGLRISMTFVDSGGHKTQSVYMQCAKRLQKRVFAIKGQGGDGIAYTRPPSKIKINLKGRYAGTCWLYSIGVDAGKTEIFGNLKVQEPGPKYCHFPIGEAYGYDEAYFSGLLSEQMVMRTDRGRTRWAWEKLPGHERNEALDCSNYATAAFRVLDPDMDAVERRLRGLFDGQAQQAECAPAKKQAKQRVRKNKLLDEL